jgi:hypothetical protein
VVDSNAAFYEGEKLNYVIYPPDGYKMVDYPAVQDGYSFAFIPRGQDYEDADLMIGVNIFKIRGMTFQEALAADTASVHKHYGANTVIWTVDSVFIRNGETIPTFYINDTTGFIPNVMMSYYDGNTEMVIFELVITDRVARFKAEEVYVECLERFKVLQVGELGYK